MIDTIGERLKKARKYAGMTQLDLAKAIDAKQLHLKKEDIHET